jgi:hypothetical protein
MQHAAFIPGAQRIIAASLNDDKQLDIGSKSFS